MSYHSLGFPLSAWLALLVLGWPRGAQADDAAARATAVQLFDEGDKLMQDGHYADACPKLAESNRLDPQLGALLYLAECYEKNGQLASAWGSYREAEEIAAKRADERGTEAGTHARALAPRLSRLTVKVVSPSTPGLELTRDGSVLEHAQYGAAIAVDAGPHQVRASAPGYQSWSGEIQVSGEGNTVTLEVPALRPAPKPRATRPELLVEGTPIPGGSQRIAAIAIGGLGIVGVGIGGFFGLSAQNSYSDSKAECNERDRCTSQGVDLRSSAKNKALVATVGSAIGAAALVTGTVLWFTAPTRSTEPRAARPRRQVGVAPLASGVGLGLRGEF